MKKKMIGFGRLSVLMVTMLSVWFNIVVAQTVPNINSVTKNAVTVLPSVGPVVVPTPDPDPTVPSNLATPASDQNFKIWIFDPRNRNVALGSAGIFIKSTTAAEVFVRASNDGSLYMKLDPGSWTFDVVEPLNLSLQLVRLRYTAIVSAGGVVSVAGKTADSRGYVAVTVTTIPQAAQSRLAALTAVANESALTFNPKSPCQLIDQVTPIRSLRTDLSAGFPRVRTRLPSYGRIRALIVPIDFHDVPGIDNAATFFTPLANDVRDFYYTQSYGRLAFDFSVLPNWLRMPFLSTKYNLGGGVGSGNPDGYRKEIVSLTDSLIDYNQYDAIYFLLPKEIPMSSISWGPAITSPIITRNGYITNGASGGADMYLPQNGPGAMWKWMAHETGHAFGLYDENLDHASATLGNWSLMAQSWSRNAIEHNGWDRYLLGWLGDTQTTCLPKHTLSVSGTTLTLNPLVRQNAENKVALVPLSSSKILVLESRRSEGFDSIVAGREGVLVYTVDMTIGQLKGGYRTQRRIGSTDVNFEDAALRAGNSVTVEGVVVTVNQLASGGDTVTIRAAAPPADSVLTVTRAGLGMGTITSNPAGINCTPTCFASFNSNAMVTLTPAAASGSTFTGWSGDCTGMGACVVPMSSAKNVTATFYGQGVAQTYSGLWWNPNESGWGLSLTQRGAIMFMAWYTYDAGGAPIWYVMSNCVVVGNGCSGTIFSVSGGRPLTVPWGNPTLNVGTAGQGSFAFSDANNGTLTYTLNSVAGVKNITRQIFATSGAIPPIDYTALYWSAPANSESGWGVSITQQFGIIFVAMFTYDATGKPIWYVASNCTVTANSCTGALFQVNGGRVPTTVWGLPALVVNPVGNITINFTDAFNGTMNFTINNVAGTKPITKQFF